jgi:hypothetical protein
MYLMYRPIYSGLMKHQLTTIAKTIPTILGFLQKIVECIMFKNAKYNTRVTANTPIFVRLSQQL